MATKRLFDILYYLVEKRKATAPELAKKLNVSIRTIYRDIEWMSGAGIPVYCNPGKGGGIFLLNSFILDKGLLSTDEKEELMLAIQGLDALKGDGQVAEKLRALFQIKAEDWIRIDFSDWRGTKYQENLFEILKRGIFQKQVVRFIYRSQQCEAIRNLEPLQLIFKNQDWYIYGFCIERQDFRLFKLSRMSQCELLDERFEQKVVSKPIEANDLKEEMVKLRLKFDKSQAFRVYEEFTGLITEDKEGSLLVEVDLPKHISLYSYLLSFLDGVEVLEPIEIRKEFQTKLNDILKKYKT